MQSSSVVPSLIQFFKNNDAVTPRIPSTVVRETPVLTPPPLLSPSFMHPPPKYSPQTHEMFDDKEFRRELWERKKRNNKRSNVKEKKIREYKIRKNNKPHVILDSESNSGDDYTLPLYDPDDNIENSETDSSSTFDDFVNEASVITGKLGYTKVWDSHALSVITFCYQMWRSQCIADYCFALIAFAKSRSFSSSLITEICSLVKNEKSTFNTPLQPEGLSEIKDTWKLLINNPIFSRISFLITAAMALPFCQLEKLDFSIAGLRLISFEACKVQHKSVDIIDAILDTFTWISETGWKVLKTGSLTPIIYSDQRIETFNRLYMEIDSQQVSALSGNHPNLPKFRVDLDECIQMVANFQKAKPSEIISEYVQARYTKLVRIKERLILKDRNTNLRFQPIGFSLCGSTGVGKSTLGRLTMNTSLNAMNFSTDRRHQITLDPNDKYQSTMTTDIEGMFIDDLANLKSNFNNDSMPPSSIIIKFFNNISAQAIKAEIHEKGSVFIDFKCGVITTNKKDLDAAVYSNCPESILRRLYHVGVRVKTRYQGVNGQLDVMHPDLVNAPITHDVWELDIEEVQVRLNPVNGKTIYKFVPVTVDLGSGPRICQNLSLFEYLTAVKVLSATHKIRQESLLRANKNFDNISFCQHGLPFGVCNCGVLQPNSEFIGLWFDMFVSSFIHSFSRMFYLPWWTRLVAWWFGYSNIYNMTSGSLVSIGLDIFHDNIFPYIISIVPDFLWNNRMINWYFKYLTWSFYWIDAKKWFWRYVYMIVIFSIMHLYGIDMTYYIICCIWLLCYTLLLHYRRLCVARQLLLARRDTFTAYGRNLRDNIVPKFIAATCLIIGSIRLIHFLYKKKYISIEPQTSLTPDEIDKQPGWLGNLFTATRQKVVDNPLTKTMAEDHVVGLVKGNLFIAEYLNDSSTASRSCIFFPRKNVCIIPYHSFFPGADLKAPPYLNLKITVLRHNSVGGKFHFSACLNKCIIWQDLAFCFVPNCPDLKDVCKLFPLDKPVGMGWNSIIRRFPDLTFQSEDVYTTHRHTGHMHINFYGSEYISSITNKGACMSCVVSKVNPHSIIGFHMGGDGEKGCSLFLPQDILYDCMKRLESFRGNILSTTGGFIPESQMNVPVLSGEVHRLSHVKKFTQDEFLEPIGSTRLRRKATSSVYVSPISDKLTEYTGIPNTFGPPKMNPNWVHYNRVLDQVSHPSDSFPVALLDRAYSDYIDPILCVAKQYSIKHPISPLSFQESIMGIPGLRFVDPLPMDTSIGFPKFGPKRKHFTDVFDDTNKLISREPSDDILLEYNRILHCYSKNERAYPIFTACLKDEVKDLSSEKVRVFTAAPVAFGLIIRKYCLPIVRFFQLHPIESEMAVGLNAFGKQWQDLDQHVNRFSEDGTGCFGMDYKAYDTRMNSQVSRYAMTAFYELAVCFGYSEQDLHIMKCLINDVCHPLVDFDGTLVQLYNMNTSGNNITVQINCIGNSLYMRMAFFNNNPDCVNFRDYVSLITYGDDNKCSIHQSVRDSFNYEVVEDFLNIYGIQITPPDKVSLGKPFYSQEELDFLKRQSNFIPEIHRSLGRLEELSIFKSLHCNRHSKTASDLDVTSSCIESALHEWFAYGREHYNIRLQQMKLVCEAINLPLPILTVTFDDRVAKWKEKYEKLTREEDLEMKDPLLLDPGGEIS